MLPGTVHSGVRRRLGHMRGGSDRRSLGTAVVLLVASTLSACSSGTTPPSAPSNAVGTRLDDALPHAVASLPFVDSSGRTRHLSDYAGKVLLISDSMTLCQETCPLDTATVVQTAHTVARSGAAHDVQFLTVTVDPRRDTPRRLAVYRRLFAPAPADWGLLTGTPAHVRALWRYLGVYTKRVRSDSPRPKDWLTGKPLTYDIEHSDEVFFLDGHTRERFILDGAPHVAGRTKLPATLYRFLSPEGRRNLRRPSKLAWTSQQALHVIGWLDRRQVVAS